MVTPTSNSTTTVSDIIAILEQWAPPIYQEGYDNSGLLVGDRQQQVNAVLFSLDVTEAIVEEAVAKGANLIVAHHPILFKGLKRITPNTYVERVVIQAIKNDIAIYAIHTNADNINSGVNKKIGDKLGVRDAKILQPKNGVLKKLVTFVPKAHLETVQNALFAAGGGKIGQYDECSFSQMGTGSFRAGADSNPYVGDKNQRHQEEEYRLEVVYHQALERKLTAALRQAHPYEEVAYDCIPLSNEWAQLGSGMVGELPEQQPIKQFFDHVKNSFGVACIRHTTINKETIKRVAWCGGSGSFLLPQAKAAQADVFITADFKYHEFFDAENDIVIADIGHYESEQFTIELLHDVLKEKMPTFALLLTECNTNPVNYY